MSETGNIQNDVLKHRPVQCDSQQLYAVEKKMIVRVMKCHLSGET